MPVANHVRNGECHDNKEGNHLHERRDFKNLYGSVLHGAERGQHGFIASEARTCAHGLKIYPLFVHIEEFVQQMQQNQGNELPPHLAYKINYQ